MLPKVAPFCPLAYSEATELNMASSPLYLKLGDHLGPRLFCLPLQPALPNLFHTVHYSYCYLEDLTISGEESAFPSDVEIIEPSCAALQK